MTLALFYSSDAVHYRAPVGLATLAKYDRVVLPIEMATVRVNSDGLEYAWGVTPVEWLQTQGVECWLYVNPSAVTAVGLSGPGQAFLVAQHSVATVTSAWLKDRSGNYVLIHGGKQRMVDVRNADYMAWMADIVPARAAAAGKRLFVDCSWYHAQGYHGGHGGLDTVRGATMAGLFERWREAGCRLVLNGGWEMRDPDASPWQYPFMAAADGVSIEMQTGFAHNGWWRIAKHVDLAQAPDLARLRRVVSDWLWAGRSVWLTARYNRRSVQDYDYSPYPTFAGHAAFWTETAARLGCEAAVYESLSRAEWGPWAEAAPTVEGRLSDLERRVKRLESATATD